mgnify:CR=1 FL=1
MANETAGGDLGGDVELEATPRKKGLPGKKLVLFVVLPLLLLVGGGAAALFMGLFDSLGGGGESKEGEKAKQETVYHDLPTMLVNLDGGGEQSGFLKMTISLELNGQNAKSRVKTITPRIVDSFQVYLRQLRVSDLQGSAGMQRLREELLLRVNNVAEDVTVKDVLFKEMLVQ